MKLPQLLAFRPRLKLRILVVIACLLDVAGPLPRITNSIAAEPLGKGIQDNSFFIEEAYNQERA
jgi:hypothetical protein